ncbi:MAG: PilZ domain-containing protein [Magnetococcales bacterium]|nr:PilZ domain-containing protein [Magnetococcales bacterium]
MSKPEEETTWRRMIRSPYDKEITLQMDNGTILMGSAKNLNAEGFFLAMDITQYTPDLIGMHGNFLEDLHGEKVTIPCQIVRVTDTGVGIQFIF